MYQCRFYMHVTWPCTAPPHPTLPAASSRVPLSPPSSAGRPSAQVSSLADPEPQIPIPNSLPIHPPLASLFLPSASSHANCHCCCYRWCCHCYCHGCCQCRRNGTHFGSMEVGPRQRGRERRLHLLRQRQRPRPQCGWCECGRHGRGVPPVLPRLLSAAQRRASQAAGSQPQLVQREARAHAGGEEGERRGSRGGQEALGTWVHVRWNEGKQELPDSMMRKRRRLRIKCGERGIAG